MKTFRGETVPQDPKDLPVFLRRQQASLEQAAQRAESHHELQTLTAEPAKVRAGMIVLADGANWNPGYGAGLYRRTSTGWNKVDPYTGTAVLVGGTVTVALTSITASSRIMLTSQVDGGAPGSLRISSRIVGTSFTITSSSATDTSTVAYSIVEP